MRELSPQEHWSAEGERRLRSKLASEGLKMTFTRPRAALARRAIFHVIAELIDAGRLDAKSLVKLERSLLFYDSS